MGTKVREVLENGYLVGNYETDDHKLGGPAGPKSPSRPAVCWVELSTLGGDVLDEAD
jgi:hypothetical protein|tara:strand:+ start:381 stop:551 length:171 start_codon:yes stop_codon:yes gene_type:complete